MLTLDNLTKSYGGVSVLAGLNATIVAGESVALIGANGSGKTTTLRLVAGLARPDSGRILIGGRDATRGGPAARTRISYLPQRPTFPNTLKVREALALVARLRGLRPERVSSEIVACALSQVADRFVGALSGGERQRLGLAVALLPEVDLYLFDEPSASLDPAALRILFDRASALKRAGRTLLFTTHVPADVRRLATRVLVLGQGRIQGEGSTAFELRRFEHMLAGFGWDDDAENDMAVRGRLDGDGDDRLHAYTRTGTAAG